MRGIRMINPINDAGKINRINNERLDSTKKMQSEEASRPENNNNEVSLSAESKAMLDTLRSQIDDDVSLIDYDKVEALREQIRNNDYQIDSFKIASELLA